MRKLWPKYENWSELGTEQQVYRYTPKVYRYTLAKNDQNPKCTGTCSRCTGTCHPKVPRMCVFVTFFHILILKSTIHFKHTSKPFHISLVTSFLLNSSFKTYHSSKSIMNFFQNLSNMGYNPYTIQSQGFVRVYSKP